MPAFDDIDPLPALRASQFFQGLDEEALQALTELAVLQRFAAGEVIVREQEEPPGVFLVAQGQVRVCRGAANGKEHVLHLAGPGQTFLEVAVLGGFASPARCEALGATLAWMLPTPALRSALSERPQLCRQMLSSMALWVRHLIGLVEDLTLRDATGRLSRHLLQLAVEDQDRVELISSKKQLASHLNLTSETLSRTLRRLVDSGLIQPMQDATASHRAGSAFRILDRRSLQRIADGTQSSV